MYTNTTRITGLSGSGIDTDSMIEKLMYAESSKLFRYQRQVQWKTWQQEAYRSISTKFQDFQNKWFAAGSKTNLRYSTAFTTSKATVTDSKGDESKAISVNSSSSKQSYKIKVEQLAQKDTYVGSTGIAKNIKSTADVDGMVDKLNSGDEISIKVSLDGTAKTITLTKADLDATNDSLTNAEKISNILNDKLKTAFGSEDSQNKVTASIDNSGNFELKSILGHEVSLASSGTTSKDSYITSADKANKDATGSFKVNVDGKDYTVTVDADTKGDTLAEKINTALSNVKLLDDAGKETTTTLSSVLSAKLDDDEKLVISSSASSNVEISDSSLEGVADSTLKTSNDLKNYFGVTSATNKTSKSTSMEDVFGSDSSIWDSDGKASITINGTSVSFTKDTNLGTFMQNINSSDAGVNVTYNSTSQKFTIESAESGAVNTITFGDDETTKSVLSAMGFDGSDSQHTQNAQDAIVEIDGIRTTRTSNTIALDGMEITLNNTTTEALTVGSKVDVDAVYDTISKFVEDYNTLIADLNSQISESRARTDSGYYEPLTEQQKKEMDDDEVELWEKKAKTGLVYKDSTISGILSKMRSTMYSSINKNDGTSTALYKIGITTSSNYTDNGKLVIDEDALKKAIQENPDDIEAIFTGNGTSGKGIADTLNELVDSAIGTKGSLRQKAGIEGTSSANENTLSKQIKELNERITQEKERLTTKENNYYTMFSNMESSITNANSQLDSLISMLGY